MTTQHWNSGLLIVRLSNVAEVFRCSEVTMLVCEMVAFGVRAEPKIFEAAYGDPSGQKYWDAHLSEPIRVYTLAHVLSAHVAEQVEQVDMARIAIIRAFRDELRPASLRGDGPPEPRR